jgi:hypothetical protein
MQLIKNLDPIRIGDSHMIQVSVRDASNNQPVNIAGDKFFFTVKDSKNLADADAVLQVEATALAGSSSAGGVMLLNVPKADTLAVPAGSYFYDITWLSSASDPGNRHPIQQGGVSFILPVTLAQA